MSDLSRPLRRALLHAAAFAAIVCAMNAWALDPPAGKVVLTVAGDLQHRNSPEGAAFDMAMLQKLPQRSFMTRTPWYAEPRKFTGVALRDLLEAVGATTPKTMKAVALNDYRVDIPVDDALRGDLLVAYALDDKPMLVRDKGPIVLMFPFDLRPELRNAVNYSRAAWQLKMLELH
jgi:hypothetical protein